MSLCKIAGDLLNEILAPHWIGRNEQMSILFAPRSPDLNPSDLFEQHLKFVNSTPNNTIGFARTCGKHSCSDTYKFSCQR